MVNGKEKTKLEEIGKTVEGCGTAVSGCGCLLVLLPTLYFLVMLVGPCS